MKITVTTIRHKMTDLQVAEFITQYQTNSELKKRVNVVGLLESNFSRTVTKEQDRVIETIVMIDKD